MVTPQRTFPTHSSTGLGRRKVAQGRGRKLACPSQTAARPATVLPVPWPVSAANLEEGLDHENTAARTGKGLPRAPRAA